jgi:hypothetical protein
VLMQSLSCHHSYDLLCLGDLVDRVPNPRNGYPLGNRTR